MEINSAKIKSLGGGRSLAMKWRRLLGQQLDGVRGPQEDLGGFFLKIEETRVANVILSKHSPSRQNSTIPASEESLLIL